MSLTSYYSVNQAGIHFTRRQASDFAKQIADDFNPLHDADAKLFCVPGDLLFALVLSRFGLSQQMEFHFSGMVGDDVALQFAQPAPAAITLLDQSGKEYLQVARSGDTTNEAGLIEGMTRAYVAFSGHNFPDILVPLMSRHGVMINPERPLVIYQRMEISLARLDIPAPQLLLTESMLEVNGKRGSVCLAFDLQVSGERVGQGRKFMALRGLRPFDQQAADRMVAAYMGYKKAYSG